jgi:hypothetical protein
MIIYTYDDDTAPHGARAFTSLRAARAQRARDFDRSARPEILKVDIGKPTHARICQLFTGEGYAELIEDTE